MKWHIVITIFEAWIFNEVMSMIPFYELVCNQSITLLAKHKELSILQWVQDGARSKFKSMEIASPLLVYSLYSGMH